MSIIIRNLTGGNAVCKYELRINEKVITTFKHNRPSGLKACLLAAAQAVEDDEYKRICALFEAMPRGEE